MKRSTYPVHAPETEMKIISGEFVTNNTSDPDGVSGPFTIARDSVGTFTVTLNENTRPPSGKSYWLDVMSLTSANTHAHVTAVNTSGSLITGFTFELRVPDVPAWTTGVTVTSHTATLASAGWVVAVEATTGGTTGPCSLIQSGSPATTQCDVSYAGTGIATLTFATGDAVTAAAVTLLPTGAASVADTNNETMQFVLYARNSTQSNR